MSLTELAKLLGVPGLVLGIWYMLERQRIRSSAEAEKQRNDVESKKADAMTAGFNAIVAKIDAHHTADIQSHTALAKDLAEIKGVMTGQQQAETSQVKPMPEPRKLPTPAKGVPAGGYYAFARAGSQVDD